LSFGKKRRYKVIPLFNTGRVAAREVALEHSPRPRFMKIAPRQLIALGIKLLLASLTVGLVLSVLGVTPRSLLEWADVKAQHVLDLGASLVDEAWTYVVLGALVVIPVWLLAKGVGWLRRRG
jgi:hypothetical protein